jgi:hypothetical protein
MIEHKAFLFDFPGFDRELRELLESSLSSRDLHGLVSFINANLANLRDPYEGEPLDGRWEEMVATRDAHQYGDFALTKYYNPQADIGIGALWQDVQELISHSRVVEESPLLGRTIGPKDDPFDPGKIGAYFQSSEQVRQSYSLLTDLVTERDPHMLKNAIEMLKKAIDANTGLYITF